MKNLNLLLYFIMEADNAYRSQSSMLKLMEIQWSQFAIDESFFSFFFCSFSTQLFRLLLNIFSFSPATILPRVVLSLVNAFLYVIELG